MTTDSRHPYTYAADYVRSLVGQGKLSRADASAIRSGIATALGVEDVSLACKLADYYLKHQNEITEKFCTEFLSTFTLGNK